MSRDLRFRAWDMILNSMMDVLRLSWGNTGIFVITVGYKGNPSWGSRDRSNATSILMQFSGLYDKNGKEIFEGDIVRYDDYQGVAEVGFRRIEFVEEVEFKGGCFYPVCNQPPYTFEVIGSIYENPELLPNNYPIKNTSQDTKITK